ncbi:MAG: amidophosphoribosyltransferase [Candidatus Ozemobacteraceae bacterium]
MCGIIGIFGYQDVAAELVFGLNGLQHRGQDAAGIITFADHFRIKKGLGLVDGVFDRAVLERLQAPIGLGHVRYATQGTTDVHEAQPIYMNYPFGLAMVHNGNVINVSELKNRLRDEQNRVIETSNDLELILCTLAANLESGDMKNLPVEDVFAAVEATQRRVQGAYAVLTMIADRGMLAFTDPHGIRPLVVGKRITNQGTAWAFASETGALEGIGFEVIRVLKAGEAVFIDSQRKFHSKVLFAKTPAFCIFEHIYFSREDSEIDGRLVASERVRMGKALASGFREANIIPDVIIDVPSSAYFFASGMAEELNVPYRRGLAKNKYVGRSFLLPTQARRDLAVRQKLNPIKPVIAGKKIAVLDDSIVRGTTSKHLVKLLRDGGAEKVYFASAAPPIRHPCVYGIDMSISTELIAANNSIDDIKRYLGADAVVFQKLEDLQALYPQNEFCFGCFSGVYPTGITPGLLQERERERLSSKRREE